MRPNGVRNQVPAGDAWHPGTPGSCALGLGNGVMPIVPSAPSLAPYAMNTFNNVVPFQNNPAGMLQLGRQFPMGMGGQNGFPGFNAVPGHFGNTMAPVPGVNQIKMALLTLQFLPNVMHNLNQLLLMQTASRPQVPPDGFLAPANPSPPQIPFILGNPQYNLAQQFLQDQPQLNPNSSQQWPPGKHPPLPILIPVNQQG